MKYTLFVEQGAKVYDYKLWENKRDIEVKYVIKERDLIDAERFDHILASYIVDNGTGFIMLDDILIVD